MSNRDAEKSMSLPDDRPASFLYDATTKIGLNDPKAADAFNELGPDFVKACNFPAAVEAYRRACAGPMPTDQEAARDRLTFLLNLAINLQYANQPKEAEAVFLESLQGRAKYYGVDHPGYAFGLEPLASLLLRQGRLAEALDMFEAVVENFWRNGHPRVAIALALRAEARKMAGGQVAAFAGVEQLPAEVLQQIPNHVIGRKDESDPAILSQVLQGLLPELRKRFGADDELVVNSLIWIANFEMIRGKQGDLSARIQAASDVVAVQHRRGKSREAVQAIQSLALALGDAERDDEAVAAYRDAVERAKTIDDPALLSQARRNFGLLLSELKRDQEAEVELLGAVEDGEKSSNLEMVSRARIALGIFYQHRNRLTEARPLLAMALQHIDPAHADAVVGRSHLQALQSGKTCGCDHQAEGLAASFREFVLARIPDDLLENLEVRVQDNDFKIEIRLRRKPEQEELKHLNGVIRHALTEFRQRVTQRQ